MNNILPFVNYKVQSNEVLAKLSELNKVVEYRDLTTLKKTTLTRLEELKKDFIGILAGKEYLVNSKGVLLLKHTVFEQNRIDSKKLQENYPDIYKECLAKSISERLTIL